MGAPPGFKAGYSEREKREIKESNRFRDDTSAWEKRRKDLERKRADALERQEEEKRDMDIFRNGDLVKNTLHGETGVIVEAGYRSHVEVLADGSAVKWLRRHVEVINEE